MQPDERNYLRCILSANGYDVLRHISIDHRLKMQRNCPEAAQTIRNIVRFGWPTAAHRNMRSAWTALRKDDADSFGKGLK